MRSPILAGLAVGVSLLFSACASIAPPQPPSLDLPQPPTDLRAARKGDRVLLTWTIPARTTDRQTARSIGPTEICRGAGELKDCGTPIGKAPAPATVLTAPGKQKAEESYPDMLPASLESDAPHAYATYAVEVLNRGGRGAGLSNQARVSLAHTLPPPRDFQARVTAEGVVLSWQGNSFPPPPADVHYVYRVYRELSGTPKKVIAGEVAAIPDSGASLTDTNIEWEENYNYSAEVVTLIDEGEDRSVQVEGDSTPETKVFTHDVFPPAVPPGLQAVFSGPGQQPFIDLIWSPVTDQDLAGYNVYRREEGSAAVKLNPELVKTPAYRDTNVAAGNRYVYSVTAVDVRGNESAQSEPATEAVP